MAGFIRAVQQSSLLPILAILAIPAILAIFVSLSFVRHSQF